MELFSKKLALFCFVAVLVGLLDLEVNDEEAAVVEEEQTDVSRVYRRPEDKQQHASLRVKPAPKIDHTKQPTEAPTNRPTAAPTNRPTEAPTEPSCGQSASKCVNEIIKNSRAGCRNSFELENWRLGALQLELTEDEMLSDMPFVDQDNNVSVCSAITVCNSLTQIAVLPEMLSPGARFKIFCDKAVQAYKHQDLPYQQATFPMFYVQKWNDEKTIGPNGALSKAIEWAKSNTHPIACSTQQNIMMYWEMKERVVPFFQALAQPLTIVVTHGDSTITLLEEALSVPNLQAIWTMSYSGPDRGPKVRMLPIGIPPLRKKVVLKARKLHARLHTPRDTLLFANLCTDRNGRGEAYEWAKTHWADFAVLKDCAEFRQVCGTAEWLNLSPTLRNDEMRDNPVKTAYYDMLATSAFTWSPPGEGWDCYRTWEALYMGSIPIMLTPSKFPLRGSCDSKQHDCSNTPATRLYADLPALIVDSWEDVTEELLRKTLKNFESRQFNFRKYSWKFWNEQIFKSAKV